MSKRKLLRDFGRNLKDVMDESCFNGAELAEELGISKAAVSRYINGDAMPNLQTLVNMMIVLECEFDDLVDVPNEVIKERS